ncbi:MAG: rhodanese-like domain-containing protein, partial [Gaiellaceae bacterium]
LNVPVSDSGFGTKTGFVLSPDELLVLHAASAAEAEEAARKLHAVGFFELAGYLLDPPTPDRLDPVGIEELEQLVAADAVEVVDVREPYERDDGFIPGSRNVPYRTIRAFAEELTNGRPVVTICESGARAGVAASVLAASGIDARPVLEGGIPAWRSRGNETTEFRRCGR